MGYSKVIIEINTFDLHFVLRQGLFTIFIPLINYFIANYLILLILFQMNPLLIKLS